MQRAAFTALVLITLGLMGFFAVVVLQPEAFAALLGRQTAGHISEHFREPEHRVHDLTFGLLLGTALAGIVAQIRAPTRNIAGQLMALTPFAALLVVVALTNASVVSIPWVAVGASTLLATALHPSGAELFRSITRAGANRVLLGLVALATIPLFAFAFANVALQRTIVDEHATLGHYGYMAAFSLTIGGLGLVASSAAPGWRLTAWVTGALPVLLGMTSLLFSDAPSRLEPLWTVAAIAWGLAFLVAAERTKEQQRSSPSVTAAVRQPSSGARTMSPLSMAAAIVVLLLVIVFVVMHLSGGGIPNHAPAGTYDARQLEA